MPIDKVYASLRCDDCGGELSQCGEPNIDGEPTLDCKVCQLREENERLEQIINDQRELLRKDEYRIQALTAGISAAKGAITEKQYWQHIRMMRDYGD